MAKTYLATKDEIIRAYKSLAEISPTFAESTSLTDVFHAMAAPSRLACTITNGSVYPASSGTLAMNKTSSDTGTIMFMDTNGRVSTGVFPWSGWQSPGYSNPNLLINWDFRNPVNQRGQSEYTGYGYTIDMWTMYNASDSAPFQCKIINDCLRLMAGNENLYFSQAFERVLDNETTYTVSVAFSKTNIASVTTKATDGYFDFGNGTVGTLENGLKCHVVVLSGNTVDVQAVKLEVGTVSTLALDLMQPPDYAEELRKCQRYLQIYDTPLMAYAQNEWYASTHFKLNQEMRMQPTFNYVGDLVIEDTLGDTQAAFSDLETYSGNTTGPLLRFRTTNGALSKGSNYVVYNLKLMFSSEL